jgi:hypothetical protein
VLWFPMPTWLRLSRWYERTECRCQRPSRSAGAEDAYGRESVEVLLSGFGSLLCAAPTVEVTGWPCWKTTVP